MNTTLTILIISTSIMFTMLSHPMSMGMTLIIQTILISMITGNMMNTFWFSYILLITMISGVLVLFIYMASIASNEKFKSSTKMLMFTTMMMILSTGIIMIVDQMSVSSIWSTIKKEMLCNDQVQSLIKLFNNHNMSMTITMVAYLFFTMIAITFIVEVSEGPLRKKN
uniref:NADH-ubiquinone oxidoreductase chain 6 n=1 Tax=Acanthaspis pedestris TaxID=1387356 RepID=A0A9E8YAX6_9HEMI|nr:NADH dehydrogenase subunit 6 [Acanthaspis pedestris]WAJ48465.1 NADH dehydrogenase subunit 6 [Acanthaspis pedestris]